MATFLVKRFWGNASKMTDALGILLLTWNQALYRYGSFDFQRLEYAIKKNRRSLKGYQKRNILSYTEADDPTIKSVFKHFLSALRVRKRGKKVKRSPVAVAKALHLLAPRFFPLWDFAIANKYRCRYAVQPDDKYVAFMLEIKKFAKAMQPHVGHRRSGKSLVKLIDEYNYARYTKDWR